MKPRRSTARCAAPNLGWNGEEIPDERLDSGRRGVVRGVAHESGRFTAERGEQGLTALLKSILPAVQPRRQILAIVEENLRQKFSPVERGRSLESLGAGVCVPMGVIVAGVEEGVERGNVELVVAGGVESNRVAADDQVRRVSGLIVEPLPD